MRLLIHYVGDIHQPLHATARVNHDYPSGDRGGNSFPVAPRDGAKNLHAVWDSVAYEFSGYENLPFSDSDWSLNGRYAAMLVQKHPLSQLKDTTNLDPNVWAKESFDISASFVYAGITEQDPLPDAYVAQAKEIAEKQIVTAGYRLANLMMSFGHNGSSSPYTLLMALKQAVPVVVYEQPRPVMTIPVIFMP